MLSAQEPVAISQEKIDAILSAYRDVLERVQSDEFIAECIHKGEEYAARYTTPDFLEPYLDPDGYRDRKQKEFNNKPLFDIALPGELGTLLVRRGDALCAVQLGLGWGLEWWLYNVITAHATTRVLTTLLHQDATVIPQRWVLVPTALNKKLFQALFMYAVVSVLLERLKDRLLVTQMMTDKVKLVEPFVPPAVMRGMLFALSPQSWMKMINKVFKKVGWFPEWSEHLGVEIAKEFVVTVVWLWHYEQKIVARKLNEVLQNKESVIGTSVQMVKTLGKQATLPEQDKQKLREIQTALETYVRQNVALPFDQWLLNKAAYTNVYNGIANVVITLPAWVKMGKGAYQTYKAIWGNGG